MACPAHDKFLQEKEKGEEGEEGEEKEARYGRKAF